MAKVNKLGLSKKDKLMVISNLGTMLSSGIPIMEAVDAILEDNSGNQKKVLKVLKEDLNQGKTISDSFGRFPRAFDPVTVNLIKAAEKAGDLDTILKDLAINIKKEIEFNEKVKGALTYPIFVLIVFVGVLGLMLVFVIPRISSVFKKLNVTLPLPTQILIAVSDFVLKYTLPFLIGLGIFIVVFVVFYKTQKRRVLNVFLSLPLISTLAQEIDLTRLNRSMALLLSSGLPIVEALTLAQNIVNKKQVYRAVELSRNAVSAGKNLSEGLRSAKKTIPGVMVRIIEAGEKSGSLDKSMQELADYFDEEVSNKLKALSTLLEPIMLVVIGILVGGMMLAIIAPIYGLIGNISSR